MEGPTQSSTAKLFFLVMRVLISFALLIDINLTWGYVPGFVGGILNQSVCNWCELTQLTKWNELSNRKPYMNTQQEKKNPINFPTKWRIWRALGYSSCVDFLLGSSMIFQLWPHRKPSFLIRMPSPVLFGFWRFIMVYPNFCRLIVAGQTFRLSRNLLILWL